MRWVGFIIAAVLASALQISLAQAMTIPIGGGLVLAVDLLAVLTLLIALRTRSGAHAVTAGWLLGLTVDLATVGTPIGLYALTYAAAAGVVYQMRAAVFSESGLTQALMALTLCLVAHGAARVFVNLYVRQGGGRLGRDLVQALLVACCTALVAPPMMQALKRVDWLIIDRPRWQRR